MRILTIVPPSNYPNFQADSIYTFNRIVFGELSKRNDVELYIAAPPQSPQEIPDANYVPMDFGQDQYHSRFGFDWCRASEILKDVRPDLCFVNMPEHASSLAILTREVLKLSTKIISYVHYLPAWVDGANGEQIFYEDTLKANGLGSILTLRLLEGILASDYVLIGSQFGAHLIERLVHLSFGKTQRMPPIAVLPPPIDWAEIPNSPDLPRSDYPVFVYNHRLYDHYGTEAMFKLLQKLRRQAFRFNVVVTNPTEGRSLERKRMSSQVETNLERLRELEFVTVAHFQNRREYYATISQSWGGFAPIKPQALWSMSVMDILACGRPVISFAVGAFGEMLGKHLVVANEQEFLAMMGNIINGGLRCDEDYRKAARQYAADKVAARLSTYLGLDRVNLITSAHENNTNPLFA